MNTVKRVAKTSTIIVAAICLTLAVTGLSSADSMMPTPTVTPTPYKTSESMTFTYQEGVNGYTGCGSFSVNQLFHCYHLGT